MLSPADRTIGLLTQYVLSLARYDQNFDVRDRSRMFGSLLSGVSTLLQDVDEEEQEDHRRVVLRREQVKMILFDGKINAVEDSKTGMYLSFDVAVLDANIILFSDEQRVSLGSLGSVIGKEMGTENYLPDWLEQGVESSLRDAPEDAPPAPTSIASSASVSFTPSRASPVILTPTGPSPSGSYVRQDSGKAPWTDLDRFYEDSNEEEEAEEAESEDESEEQSEEDEEEGEDNDDTEEDEEEEESVEKDQIQENRPLHDTS